MGFAFLRPRISGTVTRFISATMDMGALFPCTNFGNRLSATLSAKWTAAVLDPFYKYSASDGALRAQSRRASCLGDGLVTFGLGTRAFLEEFLGGDLGLFLLGLVGEHVFAAGLALRLIFATGDVDRDLDPD